MSEKYFGTWTDRASTMADWTSYGQMPPIGFPTDDEILFASYGTGCYCGDGLVLFERNGKLYLGEGSHCSCYGLEGQWQPDEVTWEQLAMRQWSLEDHHPAARERLSALISAHVRNTP